MGVPVPPNVQQNVPTIPEKPGRSTDTFDQAMAAMYQRDPSLWLILHAILARLDKVKFRFLWLIVLGVTNNQWLTKALEKMGEIPAFITTAAAAVLHGHGHPVHVPIDPRFP